MQTNKKIQQLLELAGGKSFLSRASLAFVAPSLVLISVLLNATGGTLINFVLWLLVNIFSILCTWLVVELLIRWMSKLRMKTPILKPRTIFVVSALVGLVKGLTTTAFAVLFGVLPVSEFYAQAIPRAVQTTTLGLLLIPSVSILLAMISEFSIKRDALLAEAIRTKISDASRSSSFSDFVATDAKHQFEQGIRRIKFAFDEVLKTARDKSSSEISKDLGNLVDSQVRPLSQVFWSANAKPKKLDVIVDLAANALLLQPFSALPLALIYFVVSGARLVPDRGLANGAIATTAMAICVFVIYSLANSVQIKTKSAAIVKFFATNLFLSMALLFFRDFLSRQDPADQYLSYFVADLLFITSLSGTVMFINATISNSRLVNDLYERYFASKQEFSDPELAKIASREIANYLHGTVQNLILQASHRVKASTQLSEQQLAEEISALVSALDISSSSNKTNFATHKEALARSRDLWTGFLQVNLDKSLDLLANSRINPNELFFLVEEAVSNAFKHGLATAISISVEREKATGYLWLNFSDNGLGPTNGAKGMGTGLFSAISSGEWKLVTQASGGSLLQVRIADI